jgi:hypothetical protein
VEPEELYAKIKEAAARYGLQMPPHSWAALSARLRQLYNAGVDLSYLDPEALDYSDEDAFWESFEEAAQRLMKEAPAEALVREAVELVERGLEEWRRTRSRDAAAAVEEGIKALVDLGERRLAARYYQEARRLGVPLRLRVRPPPTRSGRRRAIREAKRALELAKELAEESPAEAEEITREVEEALKVLAEVENLALEAALRAVKLYVVSKYTDAFVEIYPSSIRIVSKKPLEFPFPVEGKQVKGFYHYYIRIGKPPLSTVAEAMKRVYVYALRHNVPLERVREWAERPEVYTSIVLIKRPEDVDKLLAAHPLTPPPPPRPPPAPRPRPSPPPPLPPPRPASPEECLTPLLPREHVRHCVAVLLGVLRTAGRITYAESSSALEKALRGDFREACRIIEKNLDFFRGRRPPFC